MASSRQRQSALGDPLFSNDIRTMNDATKRFLLPQFHDADEQKQLDESLALFKSTTRKLGGGDLKKYQTGTRLYKSQVVKTGDDVFVRGQLKLRVPPEQVVAYYMGWCKQYWDRTSTFAGDKPVVLGERRNDHSLVQEASIAMPTPFSHRQLVVKTLWAKLGPDTYFVSTVTSEHEDFPPRDKAVKSSLNRLVKLTRVGPSVTLYEAVGNFKLGGRFPSTINNLFTIPLVVQQPVLVVLYFVAVRPPHLFDEADGTVLGQLLFVQLHPHRRKPDELRKTIQEIIARVDVLRDAQVKYR